MDIALSAKHRHILREQTIGATEPGRVLRDFEILLNFVGQQEIKVSGTHQLLPMNLLAELNAQLSKPLRSGLKRPQQKSYPHINGLYLLLRASGLSTSTKVIGYLELIFIQLNGGSGNSLYRKIYDPVLISNCRRGETDAFSRPTGARLVAQPERDGTLFHAA